MVTSYFILPKNLLRMSCWRLPRFLTWDYLRGMEFLSGAGKEDGGGE